MALRSFVLHYRRYIAKPHVRGHRWHDYVLGDQLHEPCPVLHVYMCMTVPFLFSSHSE